MHSLLSACLLGNANKMCNQNFWFISKIKCGWLKFRYQSWGDGSFFYTNCSCYKMLTKRKGTRIHILGVFIFQRKYKTFIKSWLSENEKWLVESFDTSSINKIRWDYGNIFNFLILFKIPQKSVHWPGAKWQDAVAYTLLGSGELIEPLAGPLHPPWVGGRSSFVALTRL